MKGTFSRQLGRAAGSRPAFSQRLTSPGSSGHPVVPSLGAAAHTAPAPGRRSPWQTCKHSPEHHSRARRSPPPLAPPAIPQFPAATRPAHPLRRPTTTSAPARALAQPQSIGITAAGLSVLQPMQLLAGPRRHRGSGKGLGAPRHTEPGRGLIPAFPSSWEGEGSVKREHRAGKRSQTPAWLLETTMGWQRRGRLRRGGAQGTHSTRPYCTTSTLSTQSTVTLGCSLAPPRSRLLPGNITPP